MDSKKFPTQEEWQKHKEKIIALYIDADKKVKDIVEYMSNTYGHHATISMYKKRFTQWGIYKNYSAVQKDSILNQLRQQPDMTITPRLDDGRPADMKRVRRHQNTILREQARASMSAKAFLQHRPPHQPTNLHNEQNSGMTAVHIEVGCSIPPSMSKLLGPEHLLRLIMDDRARLFLNRYNTAQQLAHSSSASAQFDIWEPRPTKDLFRTLDDTLKSMYDGGASEIWKGFDIVCHLVNEIGKTRNESSVLISCMILGHPMWTKDYGFRLSICRFLHEMTGHNRTDPQSLSDIFHIFENHAVTREVSYYLTLPEWRTLQHLWQFDSFQAILANSKCVNLYTPSLRWIFQMPGMKQALINVVWNKSRVPAGALSSRLEDVAPTSRYVSREQSSRQPSSISKLAIYKSTQPFIESGWSTQARNMGGRLMDTAVLPAAFELVQEIDREALSSALRMTGSRRATYPSEEMGCGARVWS